MKKTSKIALLISVVVIIAALAVAGFTGGALQMVDCPDCENGIADCGECGGKGKLLVKDPRGRKQKS